MAADTRDISGQPEQPLLSSCQVPIISKLPKVDTAEDAIFLGGDLEDPLQENAGVHCGKGASTAKVPDSMSYTTQPSGNFQKCWEWKSLKELTELDCAQLRLLCSKLSHLIRQRSSDLAPLLEEHHNLQEEIDARNVVIQQLLKLTCQHMELPRRPIQMSVIFPESKAGESSVDAASYE